MEMVDQVVVEMVRVNKRGDDENQDNADRKPEVNKDNQQTIPATSQQNSAKRDQLSAETVVDLIDDDETQDLSSSTQQANDTSICNGQIRPRQIKPKSEIKAENNESQSQSLLSGVRKAENKGDNLKER